MAHKRLNLEERREILADMYEELRGLDADLLEVEGMASRSTGRGKTREELSKKYPAVEGGR